MASISTNPHSTDFLVIGSGLAGLSFALEAARHGTVAILTKRAPEISNTAQAQGGIAAVWDPADSLEAHVQDTVEAGAHLATSELVTDILSEGPDAVRRLIDWGVRFTREGDPGTDDEEGEETHPGPLDPTGFPDYHLTREGGHSIRRILHSGDMTGAEIQRALLDAVALHPRIELFSEHIAIDLITRRNVKRYLAKRRLGLYGPEVEKRYGPAGPEGWMPNMIDRCLGAYALDTDSGLVRAFSAPVTLLATGGAGKLYRYTSNPDVATGDGMAMAYRAGAVLANMEFVQFHPTCLYDREAKSFLVSEAVRGEGGILKLPDGTEFMVPVHPMGSLAPRDIVARAIDDQIKRKGLEYVLLDISDKDDEFVRSRFPGIHEMLMSYGHDMTAGPIPVVPAAHYFCGGVQVDRQGRTLIAGLLAAGEVTCTGLHGANRLASNSLLEACVTARRCARIAPAELAAGRAAGVGELPSWDSGEARDSDELVVVRHTWEEIRRIMWDYVGIVRTDRRLERALSRIELIQEEIKTYYWNFTVTSDLVELRNLATVAAVVVRAAMGRRESRGLHYNLDCPERDDENWRRRSLLRREW